MRKKFFAYLSIFVIMTICSGAGYVGQLPNLAPPESEGFRQVDDIEKFKQENLAPQKFPEMYSTIIIHKKKLSDYQTQIKDISPVLDDISDALKNEEALQLFSAKANIFSLYTNKLNSDYKNKQERNFRSYKSIIQLNDKMQKLLNKWIVLERTKEYKPNYSLNYNNLMIEFDKFNIELKNTQQIIKETLE